MRHSKRDQLAGKTREMKGRLKEKTGRAMNNPEMQDQGRIERAGGKVRKKIGDIEQVFED